MKHKSVNKMLANPDHLMAEDIAVYAVFNTTDNDSTKCTNIVDMIVAYSQSITKIHTQRHLSRIEDLTNQLTRK